MGMLAAVRAFGEVSKSQAMVGQRLQSHITFCHDLCMVEVSSRTRQLSCITRLYGVRCEEIECWGIAALTR